MKLYGSYARYYESVPLDMVDTFISKNTAPKAVSEPEGERETTVTLFESAGNWSAP